jgi:hypothetical protein
VLAHNLETAGLILTRSAPFFLSHLPKVMYARTVAKVSQVLGSAFFQFCRYKIRQDFITGYFITLISMGLFYMGVKLELSHEGKKVG